MNISGPAAVAKPEMLFYAPGDLTVTSIKSLSIGILLLKCFVGKNKSAASIHSE